MPLYNKVIHVEKEQIKFLRFPKKDVLHRKKDQINRFIRLQKAAAIADLNNRIVKIIFKDDQGIKKVETTIWGLTDTEVILKQSNIIPLERIMKIS